MPNQLVAYNLSLARRARGWTQTMAAKVLTAVGPARWTKLTLSAAERSVDGLRVRQFTLNDMAQFSVAFGLPLIWWLLPPAPHEDQEIVRGPMHYTDETWLDLIFGDLDHPAVVERLAGPWVHRYVEELARVASWPQARELAESLRQAADLMETAAQVAAPPPVMYPSPVSARATKEAGLPAPTTPKGKKT
jgi:hypothetical protein